VRVPLGDQTHRELVYRPLQFYEGSQNFIGTHDETLSVAMRVNNPDCFALCNPKLRRSPNSIRLC
jgi:hypothetical protein